VRLLVGGLLIMGAGAVHADLYRWVDPQSGSVKYSSVPPPASQAGVQVIPYRWSGGSNAAPAKAPPAATGALELRWRELLAQISAAPPGTPGLPQRMQDFAAASAELDRLDPEGAARRRGEAQPVLQRLLKVER
jgi:hypothetical protein